MKNVTRRFGPAVNTKFFIDVLDMIAGSNVINMQRVSQHPGVNTLGKQIQNLSFAASELMDNTRDIACSSLILSQTGMDSGDTDGSEHEDSSRFSETPGNGNGPHVELERFTLISRDRQVKVLNKPAIQYRLSDWTIRVTEFFPIRSTAANHLVTLPIR